MDNKEKAKQVESLIETSRQVEMEAEKYSKKKKSKKGKKKNKKSFFLAPSVIMAFICCFAILLALIATGVTAYRMHLEEKKAEATPVVEAETTPVPTPFPTPLEIPNVEDTEILSEELYSLTATVTEWTKKSENPDDKGLYFIKNDAKYLVFHTDVNNICGEGYTLDDFEYIWVNSEDNDFAAVINITGEVVDLSDYYILARDESGVYAPRVIFNCYNAKEVILENTVLTGTLLAPNAKITCKDTYVYGQLIGKSYEGTLAYKRDIVFSDYLNVMSVTQGVEFKNQSIKKRVIELLKSQDKEDLYKDYTLDTVVLEKDIKKIMELDLSGLQLSDFGTDINYFSHVISLNIANNNVKFFDLSGFPNLQAFYMNNTGITQIDLGPVPGLKVLDISNTRMTELPNFQIVPKLEYLAANNAAIGSLPYEHLGNLKNLSINTNPLITSFYPGALPLLEQLDVSFCNIDYIDLSPVDNLWYFKCSGTLLQSLDLDPAASLSNVEAYVDTLTEINAKEFYRRNPNASLYCLSTSVVKK